MTSSFVKVNGPMMIVDKPVSERDGFIRIPALAHCDLRKPINGVTVLEEMPYDILFKNWRNLKFPEYALMAMETRNPL
ncbi:hypothetical protein V8E54_004537 [Elaphomyces granulatus]|jgi:hypothetical protein